MHANNSSVINKASEIHTKSTDKLEVFMFNVGQGDHLMLKFPTGEYGIIDFHFDSKLAFEPPVLSYFKKLKTELSADEFQKITISFICISHNDKDHIKGASETVEWLINNKVFIKNFWMCGGKSEEEYFNFYNEKITEVIQKADLVERIKSIKKFDSYKNGHIKFYDFFSKWKKRKIHSARYTNESSKLGFGEFLVDIKSLSKPAADAMAVNIGPLNHHIDNYQTNLLENFTFKILNIDNEISIDKNDSSHILKIKFGDNNLIFGGDTHADVWKECIKEYLDLEKNSHLESFGGIRSRLVKVSHHGSKHSSCETIWSEIVPETKTQNIIFGISAGQNLSYKHPNEETFQHIKAVRSDCEILATNICNNCAINENFEKEYQQWYEENTNFQFHENIHEVGMLDSSDSKSNEKEMGLLAYVFEIPRNKEEQVKIKIALSKNYTSNNCFYTDRTIKLNQACNNVI